MIRDMGGALLLFFKVMAVHVVLEDVFQHLIAVDVMVDGPQAGLVHPLCPVGFGQ